MLGTTLGRMADRLTAGGAAWQRFLAGPKGLDVAVPGVYFEVRTEGRVYVFDRAAPYRAFLASGGVERGRARPGRGPHGEEVVFAGDPADPEPSMRRAERLYRECPLGDLPCYAEVVDLQRVHVFGEWADLHAFRESGWLDFAYSDSRPGPGGRSVTYALNARTRAHKPVDLMVRHRALHSGPDR